MNVGRNDIEKIRLIHNLKSNFQYTDKIVESFIEQVEESSKRENIQRFFRGYRIEDNFERLFSWFSRTSLIHSLEEKQSPLISKVHFQVPDYMLFFETDNKGIKPILLEVKSIGGKKENIQLMKKQVLLLQNYSQILNLPLLFAIYWNKSNTWTLNTIDQFIKKKNCFKISMLNAIKNDVSIILGNFIHIIPPVFRKSIYDKSIISCNSKNDFFNEYLKIERCELSTNGIHYKEIEIIESILLDLTIKMKKISVEENENYKVIIEKSNETYYIKFSDQILKLLPVLEDAIKKDVIPIASISILEFMKKMEFKDSYAIPNEKTPISYKLIKETFDVTNFLNIYTNANKN